MLTVSGKCRCPKCEQRTGNIYRMVGSCVNCGSKPILMIFRSGDKAIPLDCPVCGVGQSVRAQRLATEDEIPEATTDDLAALTEGDGDA